MEIFGGPGYLRLKIGVKNPSGTKIFNVNIFFLKVDTLRNMKNTHKLTVTGGTRGAYLAHGLTDNTINMCLYMC